MNLRALGGVAAALLVAYAVMRYRKRGLTRAEFLVICPLVLLLCAAALQPELFDIVLSPLGMQPGSQRRLIGVLVFSNFFLLILIVRAFSNEADLAKEIAEHVDHSALRRFEEKSVPAIAGRCAVVVPAFNEADNLPEVLRRMPAEVQGLPVTTIVVADGCTDDTEDVARSLGALVISRDLRRGQGAAIKVGCLAALRHNASLIVTMDGDGQHDPLEMERLVKPLVAGEADLVQGSRILGSFEVESTARALGVSFYARLLTIVTRKRITDPSNGYRALTPASLRQLDLRQDQFFASELIVDALQKGLRLAEVPITVRRRASGISKKGGAARYAWGYSKTLCLTWLRQHLGRRPRLHQPRWLEVAHLRLPHHDQQKRFSNGRHFDDPSTPMSSEVPPAGSSQAPIPGADELS